VRDQLLGRTPKDYDVASDATPPQIRELFGHRRTLAIGAAFGVITVLGPKPAGVIEVATFREDATYSDGRHPDQVTFSSAEADASRRDFTVNGMFFDPIDQQVIDFVGGRADLEAGVIRAIGDARERFTEDKLRMLRAVRFSATFDFTLEGRTLAAIREMAPQIDVVSRERIAAEIRRMLVDPHRAKAPPMMLDSGLARHVFPEIVAENGRPHPRLEDAIGLLDALSEPSFPLALATLLHRLADVETVRRACCRWRLANAETERAVWLVEHHAALVDAPELPFSVLQPILIHEGIGDLLALHNAIEPNSRAAAYCRRLLQQPRQQLDPPPLITGDDLLKRGLPAGPQYSVLLQRVREAQLDEEIGTREEAMRLVDGIVDGTQ